MQPAGEVNIAIMRRKIPHSATRNFSRSNFLPFSQLAG
jgi:hypothetical protein